MDTSLFYLDAGDFFQPISSLQDRSQLWDLPLYNEQHLPVALSADDRRKLGIPDQQPWNDDFQIYVNHDGYVTPVESCDQTAWDNGSICYFHPLSRRYRPLPGARPPRPEHLKYDAQGELYHERTALFSSASELLKDDMAPAYIVDGVLEMDNDAQLAGPSGSGKTFVTVDIVGGIVTGGTTLDGRQCLQGGVLYFVGEGNRGFRRRLKAYMQHHGLTGDDLQCLFVSNAAIGFDGSGISGAIAAGRKLASDAEVQILLIVIDTLARHMQGEENSAKDVAGYLSALQELRAAFPGASTLSIHHTGHALDTQMRGRGSSALPAAMDLIMVINNGTLTYTKVKDGETPQPLDFKLVPEEIGTDPKDQPITSCIVSYGEKAAKHRTPVLSGQQKLLLRVLEESDEPLLIGDLRAEYYKARQFLDPGVKTNTMKNAFLKAFEALLEKQVIRQTDNLISLAGTPSPVTTPSFCRHADGGKTVTNVISPYKGDDGMTVTNDLTLTLEDLAGDL